MKKKRIIILISCVLLVVAICTSVIIIKKNKLDKKEKEIREERLWTYSRCLHIQGNFEFDGNKIIINNKEFDEKELICDIYLYNSFYKDEQITVDMLIEEFEAFCNGDDKSELIENYRDNMSAISVRVERVNMDVSYYRVDLSCYTMENYDMYYTNATTDMLNEVCPIVAKEFYNKVIDEEK